MKLNLNEEIFLIAEKVITKQNAKIKFNYQDFINSSSPYNILNYAKKTLPKIGEGSARIVFQFGTGKVLKVAKDSNHYGIEQNKGEIAASKLNEPLLPKVFAWDKENYIWLLSESVQEFAKKSSQDTSSKKQFEEIAGISFNKFFDIIQMLQMQSLNDIIEYYELNETKLTEKEISFLKKIEELHSKGIDISDMGDFQHWGINKERQLKFLDPGLTVY